MAALLRRPQGVASDGEVLDVVLVGAAATIMIRRTFSGQETSAVTRYVLTLFGDDLAAMPTCRLAETLIRSELGELEIVDEVPEGEPTFKAASKILFDLVRRHNFDRQQVELLVDHAGREERAVKAFIDREKLSATQLLARAFRRRGRMPDGQT